MLSSYIPTRAMLLQIIALDTLPAHLALTLIIVIVVEATGEEIVSKTLLACTFRARQDDNRHF